MRPCNKQFKIQEKKIIYQFEADLKNIGDKIECYDQARTEKH